MFGVSSCEATNARLEVPDGESAEPGTYLERIGFIEGPDTFPAVKVNAERGTWASAARVFASWGFGGIGPATTPSPLSTNA